MSMTHRLFPLYARLCGRATLVVGGGEVALRKTLALREAGATVHVGAPVMTAELLELASRGGVILREGVFSPDWLDGMWLVIAATDDASVNRAVIQAAEERRIWANAVDDAESSLFHVPACIHRGPLQIAISSGGGAPMLARHLRERLECELDESWGALARFLAARRERLRDALPAPACRRAVLDTLIAPLLDHLRAGREDAAEVSFEAGLVSPLAVPTGHVTLVGAGPGAAGLLTLQGVRAMNQADVIFYDALVGEDVLAFARRDARRIPVGKRAGGPSTRQADIHQHMLAAARRGERVVRLKGGDGMVFGRGGEELEFLRAHAIPYDVVPGITAALGAGAFAGIPLTHRDCANVLTFVTAHDKAGIASFDWPGLARTGQTLVIYMGARLLDRLQAALLDAGLPADTPFLLVENATLSSQRTFRGDLASLAAAGRHLDGHSPAVVIVGQVAALADTLHWYGTAPHNIRTRARGRRETPSRLAQPA